MADRNEPDFDNMTDEEIDEMFDRMEQEENNRWEMDELMPIDDWEARMKQLGKAVSEIVKITKGE